INHIKIGTYLVLFTACIYVVVFRRHRDSTRNKTKINKPMLATSILIFCMLTAHWILNVARAFDAFIKFRDIDGGPIAYYSNLSETKNVIKSGLLVATILTADVIMVWRLYIVWARNHWIIIPTVCSVIAYVAVAGTAATFQFSQLSPGVAPFHGASATWIATTFATTLATNVYATVMICFRIWRHNRAMRVLGHSDLTSTIVIIVESAAIYSLGMAVTFFSFLARSNVQFPELDAVSSVMSIKGIVFSLIIVRIGLGIGLGEQRNNVSLFRPASIGNTRAEPRYPLTSVRITQVVESNTGSQRGPEKVVMDADSEMYKHPLAV
ncbi:hypothetical protein K439DRAFT_1351653, partial [Ramaria rubella]